jgi:hypothetical protein
VTGVAQAIPAFDCFRSHGRQEVSGYLRPLIGAAVAPPLRAVTTTTVRHQLVHNVARLTRVDRALSAWEEYEADSLLPPEQRGNLKRPTLERGGLKELQVMLVERIGELEDLFARG